MKGPIQKLRNLAITILFIMSMGCVSAQVRVSGRVYDISQYRPLEAVSVLTNSGYGTVTDSLGQYTIVVPATDSIWFSYLNKPTPKYAVNSISNLQNFEISLHVNTTLLKEVRVMPPNYRLDSIQNRQEYAKAFNFQKPGISSSMGVGTNPGVGLDLTEFINMFHFRRNRRMVAFRERLLQEEEDRFINYRFSRALIIKLTQLHGKDLEDFIEHYKPPVEFIRMSTEYELQDYIKKCFSHYQRYKNLMRELKPTK